MAVAAARDLPQLSLADALELTVLVARKDPRRHPRVASRWLLRLLERGLTRLSAPWCPESSSKRRNGRAGAAPALPGAPTSARSR
jgi:hypothetical protein